MNINYIILAHKEPQQLSRLVAKLSAPNAYFYVHVDQNTDATPFKDALKANGQVYFLPRSKRVASIWGSPGLVMASLAAMREIVKEGRNGYTILLSGQCYPIKSNKAIAEFFKKYNGHNFIEGFYLPDYRWPSANIRIHQYAFFFSAEKEDFITVPSFWDQKFKTLVNWTQARKYLKVLLHQPLLFLNLFRKRRFPLHLEPVGGMQWWALPIDTIHFILQYIDRHPAYLKYHSHTLFSDEMFFQTLVHNFYSKVKPPVTYAHWIGEKACSSPETLTSADLSLLKKRPELFARKFDTQKDQKVLDLIDGYLAEPASKYKSSYSKP